eukprot:4604319-Amphidinium_carterae.1
MSAVTVFCDTRSEKGFEGTPPERNPSDSGSARVHNFRKAFMEHLQRAASIGIQVMRVVSDFGISANVLQGFEGALPESGIQVMRSVEVLHFRKRFLRAASS